jgi:trigger factor
MRPQAEKQVKVRLALETIVKKENITVTDEEVDAEYKRIAEAYNVPEENVKAMVAAEDIKADLCVAAAMKFVKDNAASGDAKAEASETEA